MREVYKVIVTENNKRFSATCVLGLPNELVIWYPAKMWIRSRIGRIFCFDTLHHALDYSRMVISASGGNAEIWLCKAKGVKKLTRALELYDITHTPYFMRLVNEFWASKDIVPFATEGVPKGTLAARAIKLEKRVYPTEQN